MGFFGRTLNHSRQPLAVLLAILLIGVGFVSMPGAGQATSTGIAAGKFGSDQVFSTTGLVASASCVSGTPTTFSTITVIRAGLVNPVTMTTGRYVSFVTTGNSAAPWGAKLYESDGSELRLNGSDWITDAAASALTPPVSFDTLRVLSSSGIIYALSDSGFIFSGADVGELFISNAGPLTTDLTYLPVEAANDCVTSQAIANATYSTTTYVANTSPNSTLGGQQQSTADVQLRESLGNFGVGQTTAPIALKTAGSGSFTYEIQGSLPTGLTITTDRIEVSGTPTTAQNYDFTVVVTQAGVSTATKRYTGTVFGQMIYDNVALRFGNGNQHSVNSVGLFEQPFYKSPVDQNYYQLTFSNFPLDMAVGIGTGTSHWTGTTVKDLSGGVTQTGQTIDYSRLIVRASESTTRARVYGEMTVITRFDFASNAQPFQIKHKYSLGQNDSFVKIETTFINLDTSAASNVHIWVGTRDDFVGTRDSVTKTRGNLTGQGGSFQAVSSRAQTATALRITSTAEGALFYSTSPGVNMAVNRCCSFSNSYNINPSREDDPGLQSGARNLANAFDGSYAAVLPVGQVAQNGGTASITWFYAAGAIDSLNAVAQAVAGASSNAPTVSRSGSNVSVSWTAPDAGTGRVVTGYQYRYYSAVDANNNPIWIESSVLPSSQLSASLTGLSSSTAHNFQVRTITGASGGGQSQTGDWSSTATLAAVPAWNPTSRSLTGPVATPFSSTIETNNATALVLSSGATVTVTGLPAGVSFNVLRASTANQFPAVELNGTPTVPGTYTVTITITDSAGNIVTSDFTFTVTSGGSGSSSFTLPIVTPTPTPVITPPSSRPTLPRPRPAPAPTQAVTAPLGPVALLEQREPTPNVRFETPTQIPREVADVLARPLGYTVEESTGAPVLPQLSPSASLAYENGSPVVIQLVRTDQDNGYVLIGDGWQVALEAADSSGAPLRIDDSGNIILNKDRFVQFSGSGFAPGSIVKVWLFSDPAEISEVIADASGNFVGEAQLPDGIPVGQHTVQLNGLSKDGQLRSVSLGVVVEPVAVVPAPVPFDFSGFMNMLWILAAGVLVFFFILWRRRKKDEEEVLSPVTDISEDLILASDVFEVQPTQQFPNDSRRKIGAAAPPNRKRFGFKPKGA
jgi:hypothetical protein